MSAGYGELLKKAREEQGYKLPEIQKLTKIDIMYIKALEEENAGEFDKPIYMKLFLKTYSRFLKLNSAEMLAMFDKNNPLPKKEEKKLPERAVEIVREESLAQADKQEKTVKGFEFTVSNPRNLAILAGGIAAFIIIIVLLVMLAGKGGKKSDDASNVYVVPQQAETMKVVVKAKSDVWMKARRDGKEEDFFLKRGQEKEWKDMDRIVFLVGNAAGVEFIVNGEAIGTIGEEGEVINGLVFQAGKNWYIDRNQGFKRDSRPSEQPASAMPVETPKPAPTAVPTAAPAAPENQPSTGEVE